VHPRAEVFVNTMYNRASATIYGLDYDPASLAGPTPGLDWDLMSEFFGSYSDLRIRYFTQALGVNVALTERLSLNAALEYHRYRDAEPYLFDTTGRRVTSFVGFNWLW
jgi:hypothetical protein